jgi:hypothetical protein
MWMAVSKPAKSAFIRFFSVSASLDTLLNAFINPTAYYHYFSDSSYAFSVKINLSSYLHPERIMRIHLSYWVNVMMCNTVNQYTE